jgi:hypothetical protein
MKPTFCIRKFIFVLLALALVQFACSISPSSIASAIPAAGSALPEISSEIPAISSALAATTSPSGTLAPHATPDEAKAMLVKAVEHYKTVGRKQALADFTGRVPPFFDRDLYVACIDSKLVQSANGGFPNLVGGSVEPLSRARWDAASTTKIDSIDYAYLDPVTKITTPKTFYYEKVGVDVCGVGAYHPV